MSKGHIFLASPHMSAEGYEKEFIQEAFDTNWIAPLGKNVNEFENEICRKLGVKKAVAVSAGTAAIHLGLKTLGIKRGDYVFCQSLTFSASANPITYEGGIPVFIDSETDSWNMSPTALEKAFEGHKKNNTMPKAVIVVHLYGTLAKIDEIREICNRYNTPIIEDAAESLGSKYKGRYTGTFGNIGIISFNGNKIITSSGGGMVLFNGENAEAEAKKAVFWATQARDAARHYQHSEIGYNYRMSNIVAGIGRGQLRVLDKRVEQKKAIYEYYKKEFASLDGLKMMPLPDYADCNCWLSVLSLSDDCKVRPLDIMLALEEVDAESRPVWKPLHLQPVFKDCEFYSDVDYLKVIDEDTGADNSISGRLFHNGVCIPSDTKMDEEDLERISSAIKNLWK